LFLGLSFTVPDIEQALSFLRTTPVGAGAASAAAAGQAGHSGAGGSAPSSAPSGSSSSSPRLEVQHIRGFPRFVSFADPSQIPLEISDGAMTLGGPGSLSSMLASAAAITTGQGGAGAMGGGGGGGMAMGVGVGGSATAAAMLMRSNMMRAAAAATAAAALADRSHTDRPVPSPSPSPPSKRAPSAAGSTGRRPPPVPAYSPSPDSSRSSSPGARDEWSDDERAEADPTAVPSRSVTAGRLALGGRRSRSGRGPSRGVLRMSHDDLNATASRANDDVDDDGSSADETDGANTK